MATIAAVVDPVGRNAYWSVKLSETGGTWWLDKENSWQRFIPTFCWGQAWLSCLLLVLVFSHLA